ncbi:VEFS-Box of polycomb protein domain-containing protein [Ditylenchus destructor]|uniref:VEFS-Box of polycomb protein domain-containing protein n=1 Tax=Ditylenchus destructor TaxID=166010 RepID=A0AAD4N7A1_9BILA|nr:VEFS-Box of polycomb protein domain-containing protein [Ditylenchus destructor]
MNLSDSKSRKPLVEKGNQQDQTLKISTSPINISDSTEGSPTYNHFLKSVANIEIVCERLPSPLLDNRDVNDYRLLHNYIVKQQRFWISRINWQICAIYKNYSHAPFLPKAEDNPMRTSKKKPRKRSQQKRTNRLESAIVNIKHQKSYQFSVDPIPYEVKDTTVRSNFWVPPSHGFHFGSDCITFEIFGALAPLITGSLMLNFDLYICGVNSNNKTVEFSDPIGSFVCGVNQKHQRSQVIEYWIPQSALFTWDELYLVLEGEEFQCFPDPHLVNKLTLGNKAGSILDARGGKNLENGLTPNGILDTRKRKNLQTSKEENNLTNGNHPMSDLNSPKAAKLRRIEQLNGSLVATPSTKSQPLKPDTTKKTDQNGQFNGFVAPALKNLDSLIVLKRKMTRSQSLLPPTVVKRDTLQISRLALSNQRILAETEEIKEFPAKKTYAAKCIGKWHRSNNKTDHTCQPPLRAEGEFMAAFGNNGMVLANMPTTLQKRSDGRSFINYEDIGKIQDYSKSSLSTPTYCTLKMELSNENGYGDTKYWIRKRPANLKSYRESLSDEEDETVNERKEQNGSPSKSPHKITYHFVEPWNNQPLSHEGSSASPANSSLTPERSTDSGSSGYSSMSSGSSKSSNSRNNSVQFLDDMATRMESLPRNEKKNGIGAGASYKCVMCDKSFGSLQRLMLHLETNYPSFCFQYGRSKTDVIDVCLTDSSLSEKMGTQKHANRRKRLFRTSSAQKREEITLTKKSIDHWRKKILNKDVPSAVIIASTSKTVTTPATLNNTSPRHEPRTKKGRGGVVYVKGKQKPNYEDLFLKVLPFNGPKYTKLKDPPMPNLYSVDFDQTWLRHLNEWRLNQFMDVHDSEKNFFSLWNSYVTQRANRALGGFQISRVLDEMFDAIFPFRRLVNASQKSIHASKPQNEPLRRSPRKNGSQLTSQQ